MFTNNPYIKKITLIINIGLISVLINLSFGFFRLYLSDKLVLASSYIMQIVISFFVYLFLLLIINFFLTRSNILKKEINIIDNIMKIGNRFIDLDYVKEMIVYHNKDIKNRTDIYEIVLSDGKGGKVYITHYEGIEFLFYTIKRALPEESEIKEKIVKTKYLENPYLLFFAFLALGKGLPMLLRLISPNFILYYSVIVFVTILIIMILKNIHLTRLITLIGMIISINSLLHFFYFGFF